MISILPLLCTNGHPTALSNFTVDELEKFITFMVTCSWGHDTVKDIQQPLWWPKNVPFSYPFKKPSIVPVDWKHRLKYLIRKCYNYHNSAFLIIFSAHLSRYPRDKLRYVDNCDHTTSLYLWPTGRLLVTFRNINVCYDKDEHCVKNESLDKDEPCVTNESLDKEEPCVKNESLDKDKVNSAEIYLCDTCDSYFDNLNILEAHERLCNNECFPSSSGNGSLPEFLSALKLQQVGQSIKNVSYKIVDTGTKSRNVRSSANIDRALPYPFSSLAYTKHVKNNCLQDTYSRERVERYCCTTLPLRYINSKGRNTNFSARYRRPTDYWQRKYVFPNQRNKKVLDINSQLLLLKCRPVTIKIERMSMRKIEEYIENLQKQYERKQCVEDKDIVFVDGWSSEPIDVDAKGFDPLNKFDNALEVIDLCSDDEGPSGNENCDPRAGITCVMKGGAVLQRTAATPQALPDEPCGARHQPIPPFILKPHPVIFIHSHILNKLQTI